MGHCQLKTVVQGNQTHQLWCLGHSMAGRFEGFYRPATLGHNGGTIYPFDAEKSLFSHISWGEAKLTPTQLFI